MRSGVIFTTSGKFTFLYLLKKIAYIARTTNTKGIITMMSRITKVFVFRTI